MNDVGQRKCSDGKSWESWAWIRLYYVILLCTSDVRYGDECPAIVNCPMRLVYSEYLTNLHSPSKKRGNTIKASVASISLIWTAQIKCLHREKNITLLIGRLNMHFGLASTTKSCNKETRTRWNKHLFGWNRFSVAREMRCNLTRCGNWSVCNLNVSGLISTHFYVSHSMLLLFFFLIICIRNKNELQFAGFEMVKNATLLNDCEIRTNQMSFNQMDNDVHSKMLTNSEQPLHFLCVNSVPNYMFVCKC